MRLCEIRRRRVENEKFTLLLVFGEPEASGLLTDCGAQGEATTRGRKGREPFVCVCVCVCRYEEVRGSCRDRKGVTAGRETVVNSVGGAGGDKAPQCGAVDTTTTIIHPLNRGSLALPRPTNFYPLLASFSFHLYIIEI